MPIPNLSDAILEAGGKIYGRGSLTDAPKEVMSVTSDNDLSLGNGLHRIQMPHPSYPSLYQYVDGGTGDLEIGTDNDATYFWKYDSAGKFQFATNNLLRVEITSGGQLTALGRIGVGNNAGPFFESGAGSPEGAITAPVGSLYLRTDGGAGTTLYVKETGVGNTGWTGK